MPVLRDLADEITRATGIPELKVSPRSRSSANAVMLLRGGGQAFYAKVYTDNPENKFDADTRYDREKAILSKTWPVGVPKMVYAADAQRVIVTREVRGHGFKHYMDKGETLRALGKMAQWLAGFHASAPVEPRAGDLWDDLSQYAEFKVKPGFQALRPLLRAQPLKEYVLTKGDTMAANFKFNRKGTVALDFEAVAYRAKEYDLIGLIQGLARFSGESIEAMAATIVKQYAIVRPIDDVDATIEVVGQVVRAVDY